MPAISLACNEQTKGQTKHLSVKLRFILQNIKLGNIQVDHISSAQNTADMMTKSLSKKNSLDTDLKCKLSALQILQQEEVSGKCFWDLEKMKTKIFLEKHFW